jgi:hypothetical protein
VQLHFQHASPGSPLPTPDDAVRVFHGAQGKPVSQIERLLTADEKAAWNGTGSMASAFTTRSARWKKLCEKRPEDVVRGERDGERLAILAWIGAGAPRDEYEKDAFPLPEALEKHPITEEYATGGEGAGRVAKIKTILADRCVRCHTTKDPEDAKAGEYPLENYEQVKPRACPVASSAMSLGKLAQTTHVHLLGFSMLYGLTGLILAFSSYPATFRVILCPLPLFAQVVDISFWWLARLPDPLGVEFARLIALSGGVVAVGLLLHIVFGLFDLFGGKGKFVLTLLFGGAIAGAVLVHRSGVIENYLNQEKTGIEETTK